MKFTGKKRVTEWGDWAYETIATAPDGRVVYGEVIERPDHACRGGVPGFGGYWVCDGRGIELCKVCDLCKAEKLRTYDPAILGHYTAEDLSAGEAVEPEPGWGADFG